MDKDSIIATRYKSKEVIIEVKWVLIKDLKGKLDPVLLAYTRSFLLRLAALAVLLNIYGGIVFNRCA